MSPDLDKKLCKKYPLTFSQRHGNMMETCMVWGFECGDGWYKIIDDVASKLEPLIKKWRKENPNADYFPTASQVKEKYGTLRFYLSSSTIKMSSIVEKAMRDSATICEICGKKGELYNDGWCKVRCKGCKDK